MENFKINKEKKGFNEETKKAYKKTLEETLECFEKGERADNDDKIS